MLGHILILFVVCGLWFCLSFFIFHSSFFIYLGFNGIPDDFTDSGNWNTRCKAPEAKVRVCPSVVVWVTGISYRSRSNQRMPSCTYSARLKSSKAFKRLRRTLALP